MHKLIVALVCIAGMFGTTTGAAAPPSSDPNASATTPATSPVANDTYDVVVIGGTPGGIAAAITAARLGRSVALVEYHRRLGGMSSSGIGKSDIENREMIQGFFREFVDRVKAYYVKLAGRKDSDLVRACRDGYYFEPSVAERVFESFISEQSKLAVLRYHRFEQAETRDGRIIGVVIKDRETDKLRTLRAGVFIDATYEGDVYASAGAAFRIGRESRDEFDEPHAGHIYLDFRTRTVKGGTGEGDKRLQTYTYRLCLTSDRANAVPLTAPPAEYDRTRYLGYLDDARSGRLGKRNATQIAFSIAPIPNNKTDVNMNPRGLGFVFVEENRGYVEADWTERERICSRIRNLTLGLLWFLQHDDEVPTDARELARQYHLCRDEFADTDHFPFQLYVREARRLEGEYVLTEHDMTRPTGGSIAVKHHADVVAVGEFPIDSFPFQKRQPGDDTVLEGYMCMLSDITRPYQIPYRIMVPKKLDGLLAPVAASTTHVAYSSIRMEPTWMALGQAAGTAAHLALEHKVELRSIPIDELQSSLRSAGAVLDVPAK